MLYHFTSKSYLQHSRILTNYSFGETKYGATLKLLGVLGGDNSLFSFHKGG